MGVSNLVAAASGLTSAIKSLQTGSAATAGTITITSVNTAKAVVMSFPTGAAGTVAVSGGINAMNLGLNGTSGTQGEMNPWTNAANGGINLPSTNNGPSGMTISPYNVSFPGNNQVNSAPGGSITSYWLAYSGYISSFGVNAANGSTSAANFNSGSNNLYAASYGAYLTNGTTLTVTGPCQWQVVEYN